VARTGKKIYIGNVCEEKKASGHAVGTRKEGKRAKNRKEGEDTKNW